MSKANSIVGEDMNIKECQCTDGSNRGDDCGSGCNGILRNDSVQKLLMTISVGILSWFIHFSALPEDWKFDFFTLSFSIRCRLTMTHLRTLRTTTYRPFFILAINAGASSTHPIIPKPF